jgi:hypothetical protein
MHAFWVVLLAASVAGALDVGDAEAQRSRATKPVSHTRLSCFTILKPLSMPGAPPPPPHSQLLTICMHGTRAAGDPSSDTDKATTGPTRSNRNRCLNSHGAVPVPPCCTGSSASCHVQQGDRAAANETTHGARLMTALALEVAEVRTGTTALPTTKSPPTPNCPQLPAPTPANQTRQCFSRPQGLRPRPEE